MSGQSSFTSPSLSISGFDSNTTAAGTDGTGINPFFLAIGSDSGGVPLQTSTYFVWNWAAPTDADFDATLGPIGNAIPEGQQIVTATGADPTSANDAWSVRVTFTQTSSNSAAGDFLQEGAPGSGSAAFLDFGGSTFGSTVSATQSGAGADDLTAFFRNLSVNVLSHNNSLEAFNITFEIHDDTANVDVPTFTEAFSLAHNACYVAGTRIATPSGEVAIEALAIGDLVATSSGIAKPVKWLGRRSYSAAQVAANAHVRPVLIRKGALAASVPHRDLSISPLHALFIDDVFIPAASLVNGTTILRGDAAAVEYIHIELDDHDVIFAEGASAETFVDDSSRLMFDNADEYYDIYGADEARRGFSAPRIEEGYQLEAMRRRLAGRVELAAPATAKLRGHVESISDGAVHGWVMDEANPAAPVELDIIVEGEAVARVLANRYRADLDHAGLAGGCCAFTVALPASVTSLGQIEVRHTANGSALPMPRVAALVD